MQQKRAALPARHELKYFIHPAEVEALRARLRPALRLDSHCRNGRPYVIRSLYFDDVDDSAYYDKVGGVMHRDKYRIRIYNHSDGEIFLERKRKLGDLIQKSSTRISRKLCDQLVRGSCNKLDLVDNALLNDLFREMRVSLLRPKVIVDYTRETFIHPVENVRVTLDKNLRTGLLSRNLFSPDVMTVSPLDDGREILEVKYDSYLPDFISAMLWDVPAERSAISKYVLCRRFEPLD